MQKRRRPIGIRDCGRAGVTVTAAVSMCVLAAPAVADSERHFYQQLVPAEQFAQADRNSSYRLRRHPDTGKYEIVDPSDHHDFNLLWLQQHDDDYERKEGGAALGLIFRMGLKSIYREHFGNDGYLEIVDDRSEPRRSRKGSSDYKLRVHDDEIKVNWEYQF